VMLNCILKYGRDTINKILLYGYIRLIKSKYLLLSKINNLQKL
jgi:hypothetical protein